MTLDENLETSYSPKNDCDLLTSSDLDGSLDYVQPFLKILYSCDQQVLSNLVGGHRQTDRQTGENITSLAEVKMSPVISSKHLGK